MKNNGKQLFERLENLYFDMDTAWEKVASQYGFKCNSCDENCCETEFYHHTYIEKAYLLNGFTKLPLPLSIAAKKRAKKVCTKRDIASKKGEQIRIMCPLNIEGKCILYKFRPMICRLHGIPHEIVKPAGNKPISDILIKGEFKSMHPGCKAGSDLFNASKYIEFDRTPFYTQMADIEKAYQDNVFGKITRNRQTIAQMLVK